MPLPEFTIQRNGVNELDLNKQDRRKAELASLVGEISVLRESATDIIETIEVIKSYLMRLEELCIEVCHVSLFC